MRPATRPRPGWAAKRAATRPRAPGAHHESSSANATTSVSRARAPCVRAAAPRLRSRGMSRAQGASRRTRAGVPSPEALSTTTTGGRSGSARSRRSVRRRSAARSRVAMTTPTEAGRREAANGEGVREEARVTGTRYPAGRAYPARVVTAVQPRLLATAGAVTIAFSSILVRQAAVAPSTAAVFRCAYALPVLAWLAWRERRRLGPRPRRAVVLGVAAGVLFPAHPITPHHPIQAHAAPPPAAALNWQRLSAGLKFIAHPRMLLGAISLDLVAVLLGDSIARAPVFARTILDVGPVGLGMLRAAPSVGALSAGLLLAR